MPCFEPSIYISVRETPIPGCSADTEPQQNTTLKSTAALLCKARLEASTPRKQVQWKTCQQIKLAEHMLATDVIFDGMYLHVSQPVQQDVLLRWCLCTCRSGNLQQRPYSALLNC